MQHCSAPKPSPGRLFPLKPRTLDGFSLRSDTKEQADLRVELRGAAGGAAESSASALLSAAALNIHARTRAHARSGGDITSFEPSPEEQNKLEQFALCVCVCEGVIFTDPVAGQRSAHDWKLGPNTTPPSAPEEGKG